MKPTFFMTHSQRVSKADVPFADVSNGTRAKRAARLAMAGRRGDGFRRKDPPVSTGYTRQHPILLMKAPATGPHRPKPTTWA